MCENISDYKWKERSPQETVRVIQKYLSERGIQTQEEWMKPPYEHCYSMRLHIAGTHVGQNGKGVTRELARASGYAEFMERLLLGKLYEGRRAPDDETDSENVLSFIRLTQMPGEPEVPSEPEEPTKPKEPTKPEFSSGEKNKAPEFHRISRLECKALYATNGCCAGNSRQEAFVQGMSEIIERHHSLLFYQKNLTPPQIPENIWSSWPTVREVMEAVRAQGEYELKLYDCSMEEKFPVACAVFQNRRTREYGVRFGAHPIWEIAVERTITELFQGRDAKGAAKLQSTVSDDPTQYNMLQVYKLVKNGNGELREKFVSGTCDFARNSSLEEKDQQRKKQAMQDNAALAEFAFQYIREQNLQIYVRDASIQDFAALQILIPGYSEIFGDFLEERLADFKNRDEFLQVWEQMYQTMQEMSQPEQEMPQLEQEMSQAEQMEEDQAQDNQADDEICQGVLSETVEEAILEKIDYLWSKMDYAQENSLPYLMNLPLHEEASRPAETVKIVICLLIRMGKYRSALEFLSMLLRQPGEKYREKEMRQVQEMLQEITEGTEKGKNLLKNRIEVERDCFTGLGFFCRQFHCEGCPEKPVCDYPSVRKYLKQEKDSRKAE